MFYIHLYLYNNGEIASLTHMHAPSILACIPHHICSCSALIVHAVSPRNKHASLGWLTNYLSLMVVLHCTVCDLLHCCLLLVELVLMEGSMVPDVYECICPLIPDETLSTIQ